MATATAQSPAPRPSTLPLVARDTIPAPPPAQSVTETEYEALIEAYLALGASYCTAVILAGAAEVRILDDDELVYETPESGLSESVQLEIGEARTWLDAYREGGL